MPKKRRPSARFVRCTGPFARLRRAAFLPFSILLCLCVASPTGAQITFATTSLRVSAQGELPTFWRVREAGLGETFTGTTGDLTLENIASTPIDGAIFYGEYFDAAGRLCFSLVFSQAKSVGETGPIAPGEVRELQSSGVGLFPASAPKEVRLYLVEQSVPDQAKSPSGWAVPFRAPVTLFGSFTDRARRLQLGSEVGLAKGPMLDLILARVSVNQRGLVDGVEVLQKASSEVELWFLDFAQQQLTFYPATEGGVPRPDRALVMVRALLSEEDLRNSRFPPRMSPWVESYVGKFADTEVPPVIDIVFRRPPTRVKRMGTTEWIERPEAPPGLLEILAIGAYWSVPALEFVSGDPSMLHRMRRKLAAGESH